MVTLKLDQQRKQNNELLFDRLSDSLSLVEVLEFCKRARIEVCCDLIDNDVVDSFLDYYGILLNYNINSGRFSTIKLR